MAFIPIYLFFVPYLLTYLGFLLGKLTDYELEELKKKIDIFSKILFLIFYSFVFFWVSVNERIFVLLLMFLFILVYFHIGKYHSLHDMVAYIVSMLLLANSPVVNFSILFIFVFALMIRNSLNKFSLQKEIIIITILLLFYGLYVIVV